MQWFLSLFIFRYGCCLCLIKEVIREKLFSGSESKITPLLEFSVRQLGKYIRETEFRDRLIGETVCRTDINTITDELAKLFGQPESEAVPNVEQGLVLDGPLKEF